MSATPFAAKLELVLKALSMSRARLAADLGVDKSVVGRWVSGSVTPSAHNLAHITQYVAGRRPGFTQLDWERDIAGLAGLLGVEVPKPQAPPELVLPLTINAEMAETTAQRGKAYEGIWRSTRVWGRGSLHGVFMHDHVLVRATDDGRLWHRMGVFDVRASGWSVLVRNHLFGVATDEDNGALVFTLFNGSKAAKVERMDGMLLLRSPDGGGSPLASPCLLERVADLTGDEAADERVFETLMEKSPVAPEGSVPEAVRAHLFRDVGPTAMAAGGDALLQMHFAHSMSWGGAE